MKRKVYCLASDCPFKDCSKHITKLKVKNGTVVFSNLYSVCREYICWILEELEYE